AGAGGEPPSQAVRADAADDENDERWKSATHAAQHEGYAAGHALKGGGPVVTVLRRLLAVVLFFVAACAQAQQPRDANAIVQELQKLAWQRGPGDGTIAGKAKIKIPDGFAFLDERNTRRFLELMGNPPRDGHYMLAPAKLDWFAVFSFDSIGYVK